MKKDNIYASLIFVGILAGLFLSVKWAKSNHDEIKEDIPETIIQKAHQYDSLQLQCDSLKGEIFTLQIGLQRYEYIMEQLEEAQDGSDCKKRLEEILKHTE